MTPEDLAALQTRVANGIRWLDEHDPGGRFHLWFEAGLTPASRMPAHEDDAETMAAWREYFPQRRKWEQLSARLEAVDRQWQRTAPGGGLAWQGR